MLTLHWVPDDRGRSLRKSLDQPLHQPIALREVVEGHELVGPVALRHRSGPADQDGNRQRFAVEPGLGAEIDLGRPGIVEEGGERADRGTVFGLGQSGIAAGELDADIALLRLPTSGAGKLRGVGRDGLEQAVRMSPATLRISKSTTQRSGTILTTVPPAILPTWRVV